MTKQKEYLEAEKLLQEGRLRDMLNACGLSLNLYQKFRNFNYQIITYNGKTSKPIIEKVRQWVRGGYKEKPFLVLYGNYGTGKTMLAGKIAALKFDKDRQVYFTTKKDFDLKITNFDEDVHEYIENLKNIDLLIIDDILSGYLTDYRFAQLFSILDHRYLERKPTIITANEDLRKHKGNSDYERLKDRLYEIGEFVYFDYPSFRSNKQVKQIKAERRF